MSLKLTSTKLSNGKGGVECFVPEREALPTKKEFVEVLIARRILTLTSIKLGGTFFAFMKIAAIVEK